MILSSTFFKDLEGGLGFGAVFYSRLCTGELESLILVIFFIGINGFDFLMLWI